MINICGFISLSRPPTTVCGRFPHWPPTGYAGRDAGRLTTSRGHLLIHPTEINTFHWCCRCVTIYFSPKYSTSNILDSLFFQDSSNWCNQYQFFCSTSIKQTTICNTSGRVMPAPCPRAPWRVGVGRGGARCLSRHSPLLQLCLALSRLDSNTSNLNQMFYMLEILGTFISLRIRSSIENAIMIS